MLTCIGIDDEEYSNKYLKECCAQIPFVKLNGTFTDPFAAVPLLASGMIDVLFLDFNLGGITAPEFMRFVPANIKVVIVSAEMKP